MVFHVVLFRPKADVSEADRRAMFEALSVAATQIPTVRRFRIGKRVTLGTQYEQMMREDYPYSAVVEFEDLEGLKAYLASPHHDRLGALFYELSDSALAYDYEEI